jgi:methylthioribose-1-phosphate isomerase
VRTVIRDSAAASILSQREVDAILVGADRIAANGDTANTSRTLPLAISATPFGVPFYVVVPTRTIDLNTRDGPRSTGRRPS